LTILNARARHPGEHWSRISTADNGMFDTDTAMPPYADGPPVLDWPLKARIGRQGIVRTKPEAPTRLSACVAAASGHAFGRGADGDARY